MKKRELKNKLFTLPLLFLLVVLVLTSCGSGNSKNKTTTNSNASNSLSNAAQNEVDNTELQESKQKLEEEKTDLSNEGTEKDTQITNLESGISDAKNEKKNLQTKLDALGKNTDSKSQKLKDTKDQIEKASIQAKILDEIKFTKSDEKISDIVTPEHKGDIDKIISEKNRKAYGDFLHNLESRNKKSDDGAGRFYEEYYNKNGVYIKDSTAEGSPIVKIKIRDVIKDIEAKYKIKAEQENKKTSKEAEIKAVKDKIQQSTGSTQAAYEKQLINLERDLANIDNDRVAKKNEFEAANNKFSMVIEKHNEFINEWDEREKIKEKERKELLEMFKTNKVSLFDGDDIILIEYPISATDTKVVSGDVESILGNKVIHFRGNKKIAEAHNNREYAKGSKDAIEEIKKAKTFEELYKWRLQYELLKVSQKKSFQDNNVSVNLKTLSNNILNSVNGEGATFINTYYYRDYFNSKGNASPHYVDSTKPLTSPELLVDNFNLIGTAKQRIILDGVIKENLGSVELANLVQEKYKEEVKKVGLLYTLPFYDEFELMFEVLKKIDKPAGNNLSSLIKVQKEFVTEKAKWKLDLKYSTTAQAIADGAPDGAGSYETEFEKKQTEMIKKLLVAYKETLYDTDDTKRPEVTLPFVVST